MTPRKAQLILAATTSATLLANVLGHGDVFEHFVYDILCLYYTLAACTNSSATSPES